MEIKYTDNVKLTVNITSQMEKDWEDCRRKAKIPRGEGKCCRACSLNIEICGTETGICEVKEVREELNKRIQNNKFAKTHDTCLEHETEIVKNAKELITIRGNLLPEDNLLGQLSKMLTVLNNIRDAAERYKDYIKEEIE